MTQCHASCKWGIVARCYAICNGGSGSNVVLSVSGEV